uniref:Uncharacterized protein n=1 Tax=Pundamilia nyererei TaxID=303518 RepID=A0A3B4FPP8_9CICH
PHGDPGIMTRVGQKGEEGSLGDPGQLGSQGSDGPPGVQGSKGLQGAKGDDVSNHGFLQLLAGKKSLCGVRGEPTGPLGQKGDRGLCGSPGPRGPTGQMGPSGPLGIGEPGPPGSKGNMGDHGERGQPGQKVSGPEGETNKCVHLCFSDKPKELYIEPNHHNCYLKVLCKTENPNNHMSQCMPVALLENAHTGLFEATEYLSDSEEQIRALWHQLNSPCLTGRFFVTGQTYKISRGSNMFSLTVLPMFMCRV